MLKRPREADRKYTAMKIRTRASLLLLGLAVWSLSVDKCGADNDVGGAAGGDAGGDANPTTTTSTAADTDLTSAPTSSPAVPSITTTVNTTASDNTTGSPNATGSTEPSTHPTSPSLTNSTGTTVANSTILTTTSTPSADTTSAPKSTEAPATSPPTSPQTNTTVTSSAAGTPVTTPTLTNDSSTSQALPSTHPTSPVPTAAPAVNVVISETNLLLDTDNLFVELKNQGTGNMSLLGLTLTILDGTSSNEMVRAKYTFTETDPIEATGFCVLSIDNTTMQNLTAVVVKLCKTEECNDNDILDFAVYSLGSDSVASRYKEALLDSSPATIVSRPTDLSVSRCGEKKKDASMFVLTPKSPGQANNCSLIQSGNQLNLQMQMHSSTSNCHPSTDVTPENKKAIERQLIGQINKRCACGMTTMLMKSSMTCARDLFLNFTIKESYTDLEQKFFKAFASYVGDTPDITVQSQKYSVVNCTANCRSRGPPHHNNNDKNGKTTVTVAVVLSCIAVFLIILISVILYMRGKRRGIIRQFRMTRLQEDDDMDDMDDFVGGSGEPSFSSSRSNLTS